MIEISIISLSRQEVVYMKKQLMSLLLVVIFLFLAGCQGPGSSAVTPDEIIGAGEPTDFETEPAADDWGTDRYTTVKASADEPVAGVYGLEGWGYVNTKGEWVIAPQYLEVYPFVDNVATVKTWEGQWLLINKDNEVIAEFDKGIEVIEPVDPDFYPTPPSPASGCTIFEGMIIIGKDVNGDTVVTMGADLYGFADITGKIVVEPQYINVGAFSDGLAPVNVAKPDDLDGTYGYIDKTGAMAISPQFPWAGLFTEGRAWVTTKTPGVSWSIDKQGNEVVSTYSYVYPDNYYKDGITPGTVRDEFGIIDKDGNVVAKVPGSVMTEGNSIFVGSWEILEHSTFSDGLYPLYDLSMPHTDDGFWPQGFIDTTGNFAIPAQTEWKVCQKFSDGMCCVYQGDSINSFELKYGYIDKTGEVVIPVQYYKATMFNHGYAIAATGDMIENHFYIIDKSGNNVAELKEVMGALPFTK